MTKAMRFEERPGGGVPILLAHAILSGPEAWQGVADRLTAAGRALILVSDPHVGSPLDSAEEMMTYLREHHPDGVHLVGHSRGATVVSWVASEAPELARTLAVIASPPQATEAFRATFRRKHEALAPDSPKRDAYAYLARIPDEDFPTHALRRYEGRALVVEAEDDPLYGPTSTLFWRAFLPYADFERVPGDHHFFEGPSERAEWLADRLLRHVRAAETADGVPKTR